MRTWPRAYFTTPISFKTEKKKHSVWIYLNAGMDRERIWTLLGTRNKKRGVKRIFYIHLSFPTFSPHRALCALAVYPKYDPKQVGIIKRSGTGAVLRRARYATGGRGLVIRRRASTYSGG